MLQIKFFVTTDSDGSPLIRPIDIVGDDAKETSVRKTKYGDYIITIVSEKDMSMRDAISKAWELVNNAK